MATSANDRLAAAHDGVAHRVERRRANAAKATGANIPVDPQGLVEFSCECSRSECDGTVRVPLYVYERMLEARNQYLLRAGHHAFPQYRTIISIGLTRIEEKV